MSFPARSQLDGLFGEMQPVRPEETSFQGMAMDAIIPSGLLTSQCLRVKKQVIRSFMQVIKSPDLRQKNIPCGKKCASSSTHLIAVDVRIFAVSHDELYSVIFPSRSNITRFRSGYAYAVHSLIVQCRSHLSQSSEYRCLAFRS